jgi:hypothetical protein
MGMQSNDRPIHAHRLRFDLRENVNAKQKHSPKEKTHALGVVRGPVSTEEHTGKMKKTRIAIIS